MNGSDKKRLLATNAAIWAIAALASFILPRVAASLVDGSGNFLIAMAQAGPLLVGLLASHGLMSKNLTSTES
ncbi:MAG: hypothetical protein KDA69_03275 [Planctomycetaceae bacterium]|nr:hypothetical protein [Planctomycetaceae bacterium]MCA9043313.1 hypothetical protein [Planctomycetaceae bacterium]MCB9953214.1 hypothetical protein [Planctomycetaceae bacterium]